MFINNFCPGSTAHHSKYVSRMHKGRQEDWLAVCSLLHFIPFFCMSHAKGSSASSNMAYMAKHQPRPIESASGCTAATAAPAPRHLTMLMAAEAVADRCMFRSVRSVPVILADSQSLAYVGAGDKVSIS